jgi:hypothetical protein
LPNQESTAPDRYSFPSLSSQQDLLEGLGSVKGARFLRGEANPCRVCQAFCANGRFFPCAAGILGGGKVGILVLDFHFSTAHSFSFCLVFLAYKQQQTTAVDTAPAFHRISLESEGKNTL